MKRNLVLLSVILAVSLPACARRVVLDPEVALQKNSSDWTVKSEPRKVAVEAEPPKPAEESPPPEPAKRSAPRKATKKTPVRS